MVEGLTKRFGERVAFEDVSFRVGVGEVFGFLGPNGAGKTTTVRTLGTLLRPTSGRAEVTGIPLVQERAEEIRQRIAIMPESPGLYLRLSVYENLEYFAGLYGLRSPGGRIRAALEAVDVGARAGDLAGALSKGLRQRVSLARALLSEPKVLFLDEPTSGLDPLAAREVHQLVAGLRERDVTVFLTTHRLEEAEALCDRVGILSTRLLSVGTPEELRIRAFSRVLRVRTAKPIAEADGLFGSLHGVSGWREGPEGEYLLTVDEPAVVAPAVARALVGAGADIVELGELRKSLEDVYLQMVKGGAPRDEA